MVIFAPGRNTTEYPQGHKSLTFLEKVESFRDSYKLWHFDIALSLTSSNPDSGFAVLSILNLYFEILGRHLNGLTPQESRGKSRANTIIGINRVFPDLENNPHQIYELPEKLCDEIRNSIAHLGLTGSHIVLDGTYNSALTIHIYESDLIVFVINPTLWALHIYQDFYRYINELLDENNVKLRENFESCYSAGV